MPGLGPDVTILDSASVVAREVASFLRERALNKEDRDDGHRGPGETKLLVTDIPKTFAETAHRFLGSDPRGESARVDQIDL